MVVKNNLLAMNSNRMLGITTRSKAKSSEKLASGYRINRAADDAAGLAISEKMRKQVRGLSQGVANTQDGVSLCQVADGALAEVNAMLNRMTKLSIQAANGTNSESDRQAIQQEINQLKIEITRIGKTTTFNDKPVFDSGLDEPLRKSSSITSLVKSDAVSSHYLTESVKVGNRYYPAAILDFSDIDETNIKYLYNKSFSFECSANCKEQFTFTMIKGDGTQSSFEGVYGGSKPHLYNIDIGKMKEGSKIVEEIYRVVKDNPPSNYNNSAKNELMVSHSNAMSIDKENSKLTIRSLVNAKNTAEEAESVYPRQGMPKSGYIDCSQFTMEIEKIEGDQNITPIQTSGEANDRVNIVIDHMNSMILGINAIDVTTVTGALKANDKISEAASIISKQRARIGAYQNRLEHTIANENNIIENTTAAESQIRDTDMATEMVKYANDNILAQVGQSMLTQVNQSKNGVLALLGEGKK